MKKYNLIITLIVDVAVFVSAAVSFFMMFFSGGGVLQARNVAIFKYFTVDSNVLLGLASLLMILVDILLLCKKEINKRVFTLLYFAGATGTTLTLFTVLFFLGPVFGYPIMYVGANFFMHLLTPVLGLFRFLFLGLNGKKIDWKWSFVGVAPTLIYGIYYMINVYSHNGFGNPDYDWYQFGKGGPVVSIFVFLLMLAATYGVAFLLALSRNIVRKKIYKIEQ
ncbi:MAG: hypothetical protein K5694_05775 [Bacilli bacterium]|nr:hypothetical protein [Bacilli bacterium]